jgi:hypothetical protein
MNLCVKQSDATYLQVLFKLRPNVYVHYFNEECAQKDICQPFFVQSFIEAHAKKGSCLTEDLR